MNERERRKRLNAIFDGGPVYPEDRRYALAICDVSQSDIARQLRCARSTVSMVVSGECKSAAVCQAIAQRIDEPVDLVWPEKAKS